MGPAVRVVAVFLLLAAAPLTAAPSAIAATTVSHSDAVLANALAVAQLADGRLVGSTATVQAVISTPGSGNVFVDTKPLANTDMQGSARVAARVAAQTLGVDWREHDYLITFRSPGTVVGGPSAGGVMTLALTIALHNALQPDDPWQLSNRVGATGTINPDGTIGPVGGIPQKAEGAADAGLDLVLYPFGQDAFRATTPGGLTYETTMAAHCNGLGIRCQPIASVLDLLEAAAGATLARPDTPVPDTSRYRDLLVPAVPDEVDDLAARIAAAQAAGANDDPAAAEALATATARLDDARAHLAAQRYYAAATSAFQGAIWVGHADWLTRFAAAADPGDVVADAVATCQRDADEAILFARRLTADDLGELYAYGAAQQRATEANDLLATADRLHRAAARLADWRDALFQASFCIERAATVHWWADLDTPGPDVDAAALYADAAEQAMQLVEYARAVTGNGAQAAATLAAARAAADDGRLPEAIFAAIRAQTQASLTVQTATSLLAPEVVDAARQGAADAVAYARGLGLEPVLPVSLIELAGDQDGELALENYWMARSLALLADEPTGAPTTWRQAALPDADATANAYLLIGVVIGAMLALSVAGLGTLLVRR